MPWSMGHVILMFISTKPHTHIYQLNNQQEDIAHISTAGLHFNEETKFHFNKETRPSNNIPTKLFRNP